MLDFFVVFGKQCRSLAFKFRFYRIELVSVVSSHVVELEFHGPNEFVNVGVHLLHCFDVVFVLNLDCFLKLHFEFIFVFDNFLACSYLNFNVLVSLVICKKNLRQPTLYNLPSLQVLASSSQSLRSSCAKWWPHFRFYLPFPFSAFPPGLYVCFQYRQCRS